MSELASFTVSLDLADAARAARAVAAMADAPVSKRMERAVSLGLQMIVLEVQKDRFTGQGPFPVSQHKLGVVSGRLRRDLHAEPAARTATGFRGRIGSAVEYFAAHELGFDGTVDVKAHTRANYTVEKRGYSVLAQSVRGYKKHLKIVARGPLRAGLKDHAGEIMNEQIREVFDVIDAAKGGQA